MWKKYGTARQATDDSMAHAHCMQDTQGYKHTLRIYNTYSFSTTAMAARTRLNVTFQYIVCAADILRRFPSSPCVLCLHFAVLRIGPTFARVHGTC
jgi:hypothetical protein